jgi:hypothetical protein
MKFACNKWYVTHRLRADVLFDRSFGIRADDIGVSASADHSW